MISRLILVQPDMHLMESLRFGFEREGVQVSALGDRAIEPAAFEQSAEVVIAGGRDDAEAREVLAVVRRGLEAAGRTVPVLYVGNGIARGEALAVGVSAFLGSPVYVRDAVTVARLLASPRRDNPSVLVGDLAEHFGLFYLARAISAMQRRCVLTLVRGLRRGELRFYDGEVTSAQVGMLHGLAAFHQLLLWTDGRFELRPEDLVRRRQIPLEPAELFADAERFLSEICAAAEQLSPSASYERDERQLARVGGKIPDEVTAVLHLFDGIRTVADVVEDSPYRVFETFRIANRLGELGLIRLCEAARPRHQAHAALAIEEWLVGGRPSSAPGYVVVSRSEPVGPRPGQPASPPGMRAQRDGGRPRNRKKKRRGRVERPNSAGGPRHVVAAVATADPLVVDWGQLLPQHAGSDRAPSPVVPSTVAAGTIDRQAALAARRFMDEEAIITIPMERVDVAPNRRDSAAADSGVMTGEITVTTGRAVVEPIGLASSPVSSAVAGPSILAVDPGEPVIRAAAAIPAMQAAIPAIPAAIEPTPAEAVPVAVPRSVRSASSPPSGSAPVRGGTASRSAPAPRRAASSSPSPIPERPAPAGPRTAPRATRPAGFSASEEAFFAEGATLAGSEADPESFEDLDKGYDLPQGFWQRLFRSPGAPLKQQPTPPSRKKPGRR